MCSGGLCEARARVYREIARRGRIAGGIHPVNEQWPANADTAHRRSQREIVVVIPLLSPYPSTFVVTGETRYPWWGAGRRGAPLAIQPPVDSVPGQPDLPDSIEVPMMGRGAPRIPSTNHIGDPCRHTRYYNNRLALPYPRWGEGRRGAPLMVRPTTSTTDRHTRYYNKRLAGLRSVPTVGRGPGAWMVNNLPSPPNLVQPTRRGGFQ